MYDLIMFDLDGTLTDPEEGITNCVKYALKDFGIEENDMRRLKRFIGPPLVQSFAEFYGMTAEEALRAVEKYRERFSEIGIFENKLFPETKQLLSALKKHGKRLVLATSKPIVYAERIVEHFGIKKYFDILTGAELDGTRNKKGEVIEYALRLAGQYASPVMVGDRCQDVLGAKENGIPCIGVRFGYAEENELEAAGAVKIAESMAELEKLLLVE